MTASKMKNRRRFITRDVHLDIPEDRELRLTDDVSEDDETLAQDENSSNRTWPRLRTWRPGGSSFASHFGLQQVSSSRLPHHQQQQPTVGQDWGHEGREEGASFQRSGNEWRYRSHSAASATSSPCLSNMSPFSTSRPEICLEPQCHDDFDDVSLFGEVIYRHSPGDVTTFASGRDAKRRSRSLNESSSYLPVLTHPRSPSHQNPPRPGSVLHRAMAWESAGKLNPRSSSRSPRPSNSGLAENFEDISKHQAKKTNSIVGYFPLGSGESGSVSGNPDHSGFHLRLPPPSSVADPMQNASSPGKCLGRHSFDMGRSGVQRSADGNSHGVERGGSTRVSPLHESVCHFPSWKNPQNRELFPGSGTGFTDPLFDSRDRKSFAETKTSAWIDNNGSGFRKPFRSKSFKLLTFDPAETSFAVNGKKSMTSPDSASINSTVGRFQVENESFLQPKLHLSMLSLNSESRFHQNNEGLNPRAMSSSNLTAQSTGNSTGNSTGISTGNSIVDSRHNVGFSSVDGLVPTSPSCDENRGEFSNSLTVQKTRDSPIALFRPVNSNLVVKRLTNLTKNPFAPNSKLEELQANAPLELSSRTGQSSKAVIPAINKRDDIVFVNTESMRSDSRPVPFTSGKVERMRNIESHALEKSTSTCGVSPGKNGEAVLPGVFQKNPKFKSAKEMYLENPAAPEPDNAGKPRRNPDSGPPATASEGRRPDGTSGTGRPNGDAAPTRLIRVFLKSSTQLKDEAGRSGIGRVQMGSVETGSDLTGRPSTQAQLKENILYVDTDLSTTEALDSIINDVNMELESTKYRESAPNQQVVSLGRVEPRQSLTNNQGHIGGNFVGAPAKSTGQTAYQNVAAVPNAEDPMGRSAAVGSNRCFLEIADTVSASKRPFELVKKRLIIPDSMASFQSKEDQKPDDARLTRRGSSLDVPRYGNFGKDGKGAVTSTDFADNSSKTKTLTDSPTSQSVPSTLDRKRPGLQVPAPAATVKCSDLETALRKIEADMGIIAKAGAKIPPGIINKPKPPDPLHTTITTNTCKGNWKDGPGVVSQTTCLFTCPNEYNEATKIRLQTSGISMGGGPPQPPAHQADYHPGLRPSSSASSSSSFVTTELDRAIEMLTLGKQQVSSSQVEQRTGGGDVIMPPRTPANSSPQSRKEFASPSPSPSPARHSPASRVTVHLERDGKEAGNKMSEMSAAYLERYASPVSAHSSCASMEPIRTVRLDPLLVVDADWKPETGAGNRRLIRGSAVRDDSFDRPDSPPIRKTLPLPKDSVIMRHRMHQKELRRCHRQHHHRARVAPGTAGSLSLSSSSSSSSDDSNDSEDGSLMRPVPKRATKSKGVAAVKEELEESSDRNDERESTFSSTTSIRPLSVDGSLLSEENL